MAFNDCGTTTFILGNSLVLLAFIQAIFSINYYNSLKDPDVKASHTFPYDISIIILIGTLLYFLFEIRGVIMDFF